ncbi:MAG: hypothetical protein FWC61_01410 [Proteobacteria bacterium]|nr:hypothetical protein [Pseudomonadota bacterium]
MNDELKPNLTESETYRVAKWAGINIPLLAISVAFVAERGDFGWFILPGILGAITTPLMPRLFKKINKQDLLRILGIWARATATITPFALGLLALGRNATDGDPRQIPFSIAQAVEFTGLISSIIFTFDFWIESQIKMNAFRETRDLRDTANDSPITKTLVQAADAVINPISKIFGGIKNKFSDNHR